MTNFQQRGPSLVLSGSNRARDHATQRIPVVLAFDTAFRVHAAVTITSIFLNCARSNPAVYALCAAIDDETISSFRQISETFGRDITLIQVDTQQFAHFGVSQHISLASYFRLLCAEAVSEDRLIYLDCDLIVQTDLGSLFNVDLHGALVAGCVDRWGSPHAKPRLSLPAEDPYLNAGVLLINADAWRRERIVEQALRYYEGNKDKIVWHDQDVMNAVLVGRKLVVEDKWNVLQQDLGLFNLSRHAFLTDKFEGIFHFNSGVKPWMKWSDPWARRLYATYLHATPFRGNPQMEPTTVDHWLAMIAMYDERGRTKDAAEARDALIRGLVNKLKGEG